MVLLKIAYVSFLKTCCIIYAIKKSNVKTRQVDDGFKKISNSNNNNNTSNIIKFSNNPKVFYR